jgi:oligopeptide/dipeptide ABC transporter ATP-binding protein
MPILTVNDLTVEFKFRRKSLIAVNNVCLDIDNKEIVGLVGESGSGKSMTALSIIKLIPYPGIIKSGEIRLNGINGNLLSFGEESITQVRGKKISMVFQDPLSSLNPCFKIGWQLEEVIKSGKNKLSKNDRVDLVLDILSKVRLKNAKEIVDLYPHQLSGGMRQRVIIAMSLVLNPVLILADEPTTALDVTTQEEIFNLIQALREKHNISFLVISHDLYLISERCDRIYVMYAGQLVEEGTPKEIFESPLHPYTLGLIKSTPELNKIQHKLEVIPGNIEDLTDLPDRGCFFQKRCRLSEEICKNEMPDVRIISENRFVRCHRF